MRVAALVLLVGAVLTEAFVAPSLAPRANLCSSASTRKSGSLALRAAELSDKNALTLAGINAVAVPVMVSERGGLGFKFPGKSSTVDVVVASALIAASLWNERRCLDKLCSHFPARLKRRLPINHCRPDRFIPIAVVERVHLEEHRLWAPRW